MNSLGIYFEICMCSYEDNWEIDLTIWNAVPCPHFYSFAISVKWKVLFSAVLELHVTNGWYLSNMVSICFPLPYHCCVHISVSPRISRKTISQNFQGFWAKRFGDAAKNCWFHNDSINLIKNTGEGIWFSVFLMMLPKHIHMGRNFQRILKSSISFILKNIFIFCLHFYRLLKYFQETQQISSP